MTSSDDQHIDLVIKGDSRAFAVLVDSYKNLVFSLAMKMLNNREEAEEVSQDTFIKVFKSLEKFKGDSKFSTWIYKVAYNTCLDRLKKNKHEQKIVPIDEFTEFEVKTIDNALYTLEKKERSQTIQNCIQSLPSEDAFLLTLFYFEEQSLEEISKVMAITPNNVKVKLFRVRKKLTSILKERLETEILEYYEN